MGENTTKSPEYWKYLPQRWLLSDKVRKMPLIAVAGYRFIVDHAYMQQLPGLLPKDDDKLCDWARMTTREWKKYRNLIENNFEIVVQRGDERGVLYMLHPYIARLYREWSQEQHARACKGIAAASSRWQKRGSIAPKMPQHADPYQHLVKHAKEVSNKLTSAQPPPLLGSEGRADEKLVDRVELAESLRRALRDGNGDRERVSP